MAMKKLSVDLQCLLSSSLQINNFKRVVEELVYNSLDSKATSIAVRVDKEENKIQIVDNGCGITERDFDMLGQKYSTSKCVDLNTLKSVPNTYGFRGQFLSNLINIAQKVKITSRFQKGEDTWVKIFYNGKERDLAKTTTRPSIGTTVEVSGLFYNLHIQSKNLESLNELSEIKTLLKQLSLVHNTISISLRDDTRNEIIFKAHKNRNIYQTIGLLFKIDEKDVVELKVEKKEYKVTAYIGAKSNDVGQYHWIYLNRKFLNTCKLHKIVNDNFNKSLKDIPKRKIKTKVDMEEDIFTKKNVPFYIIFLSCPYYDYDISDSSKHTNLEFKNWQEITNLLKKLIMFYTGDETLKKQLKHETTVNNDFKAKVTEDDTRDQVRKIVERLLKSNSKKLGISQMQNGVKGKLTKRIKKRSSLNISVSKVIPSKTKIIRHPLKVEEKKKDETMITELKDDNLPDPYTTEFPIENVKKVCVKQIQEKKYSSKHAKTSLKHGVKKRDRPMRIQKYKVKKSCEANVSSDSFQTNSVHKDKNMNYIDIDKIDIQHQYIEEATNHNFRENEPITKENYTSDLCKITNTHSNNQTARRNYEQVVVYDYIPHPLNSTQSSDIQPAILKQKPHISSRDLVKTILSTQCHNYLTNGYNSSRNVKKSNYKHQEISSKFKKDFVISPKIKQNKIHITKNTRESTFNAWNFDLHSGSYMTNKFTDNCLFVSKMTFESHQYHKKNIDDNNINRETTKIKDATKFITKQSKENFIVSVEKQKTKQSHTFNKCRSKFNFHDINNMSFGIKNFLQEPSFMIEFSDGPENSKLYEQNYNEIIQNNSVYTNSNARLHKSDKDEKNYKEYDINAQIKNTYTIHEDSLNITDAYNMHCQNYESIRYTEHVLQETYTIETKNENRSNERYNDQEPIKVNTLNDKDNLNVVFISKPQIEIDESTSAEIIEPINMCKTILNSQSLSGMEIDLNHDISQQCSMTRRVPSIVSARVSLQEVSHHFNGTLNNTNNITVPNISLLSNKEDNVICNEDNVRDAVDTSNFNSAKTKNTIKDGDVNPKNLKEPDFCDFQNLSPNKTFVNNFSIKNRPRYMPKGMSQIFENSNTKGICDYNLNEEYYKCNIYKEFTNEVEVNTEIFEPRIKDGTEETTKAIEKVNTRIHREKSSLTFDGQLLKQAKILGQIDGKFIAAIVKSKSEINNFLVLFDQHAVHERIRLENNMSDYFKKQQWKSVKLDVFVLNLTEDEILYLHNHKEKFKQLGLEWNIDSNCEVSVLAIPEAILGKNFRQVEKVMTAVKNLILEEINAIKSQGGCISLHPKAIMDLVFSEACRYAIKFGDKLTINDCRELIQSLSECRTPFQCAHGRPVMAVLMEMTNEVYEYKIDLSKISSFSGSN